MAEPGEQIAAVLFDLDDTLYGQGTWLAGAWASVAAAGARTSGVEAPALLESLRAVAAEGSDRGRIIDRALAAIGADHVDVTPLVDAFRAHDPGAIDPYEGVVMALEGLRRRVPIGLVSDGDVAIQRRKLAALGLSGAFDVVVWSDDLGRRHRKPDPAPFLEALGRLGQPADRVVFVGDRPDKDVRGAHSVGMRVVRVRTGEYAEVADLEPPWRSADTATDAIEFLLAVLDGGSQNTT